MNKKRVPIHKLPIGIPMKTPKWWCKRDIEKGEIEDVFSGQFAVFHPNAHLYNGTAFAMANTMLYDKDGTKIMAREIPATNEAFDVYNENVRRLFGIHHPHFFFLRLGRDGFGVDNLELDFNVGEKVAVATLYNQEDLKAYLKRHIDYVVLAQTVATDEVVDELQFPHYQLVFNYYVTLPRKTAKLLLYADNLNLIAQWNKGLANRIYTIKPHLSGWYTRFIDGDKRSSIYSMLLGISQFSEDSGIHDWPKHFHQLDCLFEYAAKGDQTSFDSCLEDMKEAFDTAMEEAKR